jgi:hypothetical protein
VLILGVSLEEVWCVHTPRDNKPASPPPFIAHLMERFPGIWTRMGRLGWQWDTLQYWSPSNQEPTQCTHDKSESTQGRYEDR